MPTCRPLTHSHTLVSANTTRLCAQRHTLVRATQHANTKCDSQIRPTAPAPAPHSPHIDSQTEILSRVPGDSLDSLQRLLNGPRSPIYSYEFQEAWQRHTRAAVDARKGRKSTASGAAATGGRSGTRRQRVGGFSWGGGVQGWSFDGLWGGARGSGDAGGWFGHGIHGLVLSSKASGWWRAVHSQWDDLAMAWRGNGHFRPRVQHVRMCALSDSAHGQAGLCHP